MTITCPVNSNALPPQKTKPAEWKPGTKSLLETLAENRALALEAQAAMYRSVDPIVAKQQAAAVKAQTYWEGLVFDAGRRAQLDPRKTRNVEVWLANWLGIKSASLGNVREPLLNVKRLSEGMLREAAVYAMQSKTRKLADTLKAVARRSKVTLKADDARRILEEGMTPQRLAVYGNTPQQQARLATRYADFRQEFLDRGFTSDDIEDLLTSALDVSAQFDEMQAVSMATGMNVGELHNIGYFPRQFSDDGYRIAKLHGIVDTDAEGFTAAALSKSRSTWEYLPEDHTLAAKLLDVTPPELHQLIADPVNFAEFLSARVTGDQLDLLVDSGVFSKIPMLTSHVEELLSRTYKLPLTDMELFIRDPLEASGQLVRKLQTGAENSSLVKYLETEGFKSGWLVPKALVDADPAQFGGFRKLNTVKAFANRSDNVYLHPSVADHLNGILTASTDPGAMSELARAYQWFTQTFAKQALGNPIAANVYLSGQFLGNMLAAHGRGVSPHIYVTAFADIVKLSTQGLDAFDNVKPYRIIDGVPASHREVVARTVRMFSRDILPGMSGANMVLDVEQLDPRYILKQLHQLRLSAQHTSGYAGEFAKLVGGKADAVLTPVLKVASLLDLAGQLAIVKGRSQLAGNGLLDGAAQLVGGWSTGKFASWDEITLEVKRGIPMFDDLGKIPRVAAQVFPFSSWAIANLPLQLKSMVQNPSRWANYMRAHALWNNAQQAHNGIYNGEMQDWERDEYGLVGYTDPVTRKTRMLMMTGYDPRWGALTGLFNVFDTRPTAKDIRDGTRKTPGSGILQSAIGKSYFAGVYEAASGINPQTGFRRDDSPYKSDAFAGIPMPGWMASVLSISPVLSSLDRLEVLSGTKAVLDPRTGSVVKPAVEGWLGNQGTLTPKQLQGAEATAQFLGARIRVIDGITNMQYSESDTFNALGTLNSKAFSEQKQLAQDLKSGAIKRDSPQYTKRVATIHRMYDTALQLNLDLKRISAWAVVHKVPSREMLRIAKDRNLAMDGMPLPGAEYVQQLMQQSADFKNHTP